MRWALPPKETGSAGPSPVCFLSFVTPTIFLSFSFLFPPVFSPPAPQHLSQTTQLTALETFPTQRLFQRQPRGPQGSNPPNQTRICSLYANIMYLDVGAPLAHGADKQKHMAEPGRATASAGAESRGWWKALHRQRPRRRNHPRLQRQRALPGCEVPCPCPQRGCA